MSLRRIVLFSHVQWFISNQFYAMELLMHTCRDLKLENLLLDASGKVLKITDFGFAKNLSEGVAKTVLGTAVYVAPEVLDGLEYDGYQVDIWACGIVLYVMVAGRYPFDCGHHGGVGPQDKRQNAELMLKVKIAICCVHSMTANITTDACGSSKKPSMSYQGGCLQRWWIYFRS
eukprot:SAG31_NODE_744_length_12415_cov_74.120900_7_plen_174_part_00